MLARPSHGYPDVHVASAKLAAADASAGDVERAFAKFVETFGGEAVARRRTKGHRDTAFLFPKEGAVAKLQKLVSGNGERKRLSTRIHRLFDAWHGKLRLAADAVEGSATGDALPARYQRQLTELHRTILQRRVVGASRQIKDIAERYRVSDVRGLLIILDVDGQALDPRAVLFLIWRILGAHFEHIGAIVYCTCVDEPRETGRDARSWVWAYATRERVPTVSTRFLDALFDGWCAHMGTVAERRVLGSA